MLGNNQIVGADFRNANDPMPRLRERIETRDPDLPEVRQRPFACAADLRRPDSDAKGKAMLFYGLAGMMGFFAFGFLLPGLLAEPGFLVVSLVLVIVALTFFLVGKVS